MRCSCRWGPYIRNTPEYYIKKDSIWLSTNRKLSESNTAQNGQQHKKRSEANSEVGIYMARLYVEIPKNTTFQQRCHHEDRCAIWIYMLTLHSSTVSSPPSPLLKDIPNANRVGPFGQFYEICPVLFTPTWDAAFAINSKTGKHQAENGCTLDEKQKNESTHEMTLSLDA